MADKTNKSHFTQKQTEKDDKPSPEELKLRKLYDIVQKLQTAVEHKESNYERISHKEQTKQNVNLKSNYSNPTTSRIKEDRSDRDFINNFLNDDHMNILPKNMHLLTDNDTNQSISPHEKYKNLSNLMLDDKSITEFYFIRNSEERIKLNLYTALSKKSRDLFMNDNHPKQSKTQILFHKINDIHIPKFGFKPTIAQNIDNNKYASNNSYNELSENNLEKSSCPENNNNNEKSNNNNEECLNNETEEKKFSECYFRQEKKGYFHIPTLIKIGSKPVMKKEFRKQKTYIGPTKIFNPFKKEFKKQDDDIFWDPEIDSDTLSYINHNFISIEDIYNGKNLDEKKDKNKNDQNQNDEIEPNLIPIKAKEINYDKEWNMNNFVFEKEKKREIDNIDYDKLKFEKKNNNKFIEFIAITPGVIRSEYQVFPKAREELKFGNNLKKDFKDKINTVSEIDLSLFPRNGIYSGKKIERILRFKKYVKEWKEIEITLGPKNTTTEESEHSINEINEIDEIKIGKINNFKDGINKDKSFSEIDEKKSFLYEEVEFDGSQKNINSIYSQNSNLQSKTEKKTVFNFNEDNSNHSPFSSEKSKSISNDNN